MTPKYKRILLKLSGEALAGQNKVGISLSILRRIIEDVTQIYKLNVQIGIVIGGGNIFRGIAASTKGMDRASSDYMGMLATCINALALQDLFEKRGIPTRVQSAIVMAAIAEAYVRRRAIRHLEKNRIVIFAAGTGNPYFTTDTAAALRAMEINADIIFKATKVDGIYDKDPFEYKKALKYTEISYTEVLKSKLNAMDAAAISLCRDNKIPILVFNLNTPENILRAACGEKIGTIVSGE